MLWLTFWKNIASTKSEKELFEEEVDFQKNKITPNKKKNQEKEGNKKEILILGYFCKKKIL